MNVEMTNNRIEISVTSINLILVLMLIILPIYPCQETDFSWATFGAGEGPYTYIGFHSLPEVLVNGFEWQHNTINVLDYYERWQHSCSAFFLLLYVAVILAMNYFLMRFSERSAKSKRIVISEYKYKKYSKIAGIIFIIAAIYFSIFQLIYYIFTSDWINISFNLLLIHAILISLFCYAAGYLILYKYKPPRAGSGEARAEPAQGRKGGG
jgi:hypothetical protein